jgi:hypothetical protein
MAQVARDRGKQKELWLFDCGGGKPTTRLLRHRDKRCDPTAHLVPELRKRMASLRRVDPVRFAEATSRNIDWEALAYWARPALEKRI